MTRAVIYARYSSDNQRDSSIADQIAVCKRIIEQNGWNLIETYADAAISGANPNRPDYQRLLVDAEDRKFDIVVAEALDRLSRDQEDVARLYKHLSFGGVRIITVAEGEISELHVGLKGTMNALFLKDLAQKTHRGLEGRVRQGKSAGGKTYGYDIVRSLDEKGEPIRGSRKINDQQAAVVQRIYREFAAGRSPAGIAKQLNAEAIPGPCGRVWQGNAISGHSVRRTGILRNELYVGKLVWNRQRFLKDPRSGKRVARINPASEWIINEVPELRIIDDDLWSAVAHRLEERDRSPRSQNFRATRFWKKRRPAYLLTKLVRCAACRGNYTSVGGDYLACAAARKAGTCDNTKGIRRNVLEDFVLETLKDHLMHPDLVKEFIAAFHAELNAENRNRVHLEQQSRKELADVERRLDGLVEAIAEGLRSPEIQTKLDDLSAQKRNLEHKLTAAEPSAPVLHPNLAELYRRKVADLRSALNSPEDRDAAVNIMRTLIDHVAVESTDEGFRVEFVGEIANMIKIPHGKTAINIDNCEIAVKRVAGPATTYTELGSDGPANSRAFGGRRSC